jgi:uncharacterized protein YbaA (DUF1428 family)
MRYVDGFVIPIPKKNVAAYRRLARAASKVWMDHGALEYRECVGDDLNIKGVVPFTKPAQCKVGETVIFAWITYKSRSHRDRVNAKVMKDPRIAKMMSTDPKKQPFDMKRMVYGGFKTIVEA